MDSSNNLLDYVPRDLLTNQLEEDQELFVKTEETVIALISQLKPIMKYITYPVWLCEVATVGNTECFGSTKADEPAPGTLRGIYLCRVDSKTAEQCGGLDHLFLRDNGLFFLTRNAHGEHYRGYIGGGVWINVPFKDLLGSLQAAFKVAVERREKQLETLGKRKELLDKIVKLIKN